ncbi:MAG: flagellar hook-length control protein FliK [bacterium]|jgi:hypothetical protein
MGRAIQFIQSLTVSSGNDQKSLANEERNQLKADGTLFQILLNKANSAPARSEKFSLQEGKFLLHPMPKTGSINLAPNESIPEMDEKSSSFMNSVKDQITILQLPKGSITFDQEGNPKINDAAYLQLQTLSSRLSEKPVIQTDHSVPATMQLSPERRNTTLMNPQQAGAESSRRTIHQDHYLDSGKVRTAKQVKGSPNSFQRKPLNTGTVSSDHTQETHADRVKPGDLKKSVSKITLTKADNPVHQSPESGQETQHANPLISEKNLEFQIPDQNSRKRKTTAGNQPVTEHKKHNTKDTIKKPEKKADRSPESLSVFQDIKTLDPVAGAITEAEVSSEDSIPTFPEDSAKSRNMRFDFPKPQDAPQENELSTQKNRTGHREHLMEKNSTPSASQKIKHSPQVRTREASREESTFSSANQEPATQKTHVTGEVENSPHPDSRKAVLLSIHPDDLPRDMQSDADTIFFAANEEEKKQIARLLESTLLKGEKFEIRVLKIEVHKHLAIKNEHGMHGYGNLTKPESHISLIHGKNIVSEKPLFTNENGFHVLRSLENPIQDDPNVKPANDTIQRREHPKTEKPGIIPELKNQDQSTTQQNNPEQQAGLFKQHVKSSLERAVVKSMNNREAEPVPFKPVQADANSGQFSINNQSLLTNQSAASPSVLQSPVESQPASMTKEYVEQIARLQEMTARQIVRTVHGSIGAERSHISLQLTPESMGRIFIQMTMNSGHLVAQIHAEKESTRLVLEKNMNLLRSSFDEQGIRVERLVIAKDTFDQNKQDLSRENPERSRQPRDESFHQQSGEQQGSHHRKNQQRKGWDYWTEQLRTMNYFFG